MSTPFEPVLPAPGDGQHVAQTAQKLAAVTFAAFGHGWVLFGSCPIYRGLLRGWKRNCGKSRSADARCARFGQGN